MPAIEALSKLTARYHRQGKTVHLSLDCCQLLGKANAIIDVNILKDPLYTVAGADVTY